MRFWKNPKAGVLCILMSANAVFLFGAAGRITGLVTDTDTGNPLPGANVYIEGTNMGAATNLRGEYNITSVPVGSFQMKISYMGYDPKTVDVQVRSGAVTTANIALNYRTLEGEEVVITAQAAGQTAAINQQIQAADIRNVVDAERIQEIPEASAAQAVGRLPGVSLKGNNVVVRGLSSHFNRIQLDGVNLPSNNDDDRSVSMGMISQYMLSGIELTKSALASEEAGAIGGIVNLTVRKAPVGLRANLLVESGYNTLSKSTDNIKLVGGMSNRFLNDKLGIFTQLTLERSNGASDVMTANVTNTTQMEVGDGIALSKVTLNDNDSKMKARIGATLVLDYKLKNTELKWTNFFSTRDDENITRTFTYENTRADRSANWNEKYNDMLSSSLHLEQYVGRFRVNGTISYARSESGMPKHYSMNSVDLQYMRKEMQTDLPVHAPNYISAKYDTLSPGYEEVSAGVMSFDFRTDTYVSDETAAKLSVNTNINVSRLINVDLEIGGKYKMHNNEYDEDRMRVPMGYSAMQAFDQEKFQRAMSWLPDRYEDAEPAGGIANLAYRFFNDPGYHNKDFLIGDYDLRYMFDIDKLRELNDWFLVNQRVQNFRNLGEGFDNYYIPNWEESVRSDYKGNETYTAFYVNPTIKIGKMLTLIPGVRYEKNETEYSSVRLPEFRKESSATVWHGRTLAYNDPAEFGFDTTTTRSNAYWLPMLHARVKPVKWMDIRAAYTQTLSRPRYRDIIPYWQIGGSTVNWNNPHLDPALSQNYDLYLSFYQDKIGLLTLGAFGKRIEKMVFQRQGSVLTQARLDSAAKTDALSGLEKERNVVGKKFNYEFNLEDDANVWGFEVEWQSNFWWLPGFWKGLVLNFNYTHMFSEVMYPDVVDVRKGWTTTRIDTAFKSRFLDQPESIFNAIVGYDYKKFSARVSARFEDDLFLSYNEDPRFRAYSSPEWRWDLSIKQGLPVRNMSMFCNITNLTQSKSERVINGKMAVKDTNGNNVAVTVPTRQSFGGVGIAVGLRYRL